MNTIAMADHDPLVCPRCGGDEVGVETFINPQWPFGWITVYVCDDPDCGARWREGGEVAA